MTKNTRSTNVTRHALYPVYVAVQDILLNDDINPDFYTMLTFTLESQLSKITKHRNGTYTSAFNVNQTVPGFCAYVASQVTLVRRNILNGKTQNFGADYIARQEQYLASLITVQELTDKHVPSDIPRMAQLPSYNPERVNKIISYEDCAYKPFR